MALIQQASGTFTGTTLTPTLPAASSASNGVVIIICGNTTITTPTNWNLRASQVNYMGHYWLDRIGTPLTSVTITCGAGSGTWWAAEIAGAYFFSVTGANNIAASTTYTTPTLTPTAGTREIIASIGSTTPTSTIRTADTWLNGFQEQADICQAIADYPMQAVAVLNDVYANGTTTYSTGATYSAPSEGRSALIGSYATTIATSDYAHANGTLTTHTANGTLTTPTGQGTLQP